jgi:glycolate oxidase iron-sulfur subunit
LTTPFAELEPLTPLMDACVHCGFCLPTCPSYLLLGQEMDSPRGRIVLMKAGLEGRASLTAPVVEHFDTCLGCMACETACPSGVRYAPLIEHTRAAIEHHHSRTLGDRLFRRVLFWLLPYPSRLRIAAWPLALVGWIQQSPRLLSRLPSRLRGLIVVAPARAVVRAVPAHTPAAGEQRLRVGLVTGCVQQVFFGDVNESTVRVLAAEGCAIDAPATQGCCGALALHAGQDEDARQHARRLIAAFEGTQVDQIVVNAAGCGSTLKHYDELLKDDPQWAARARAFATKVRDLSETLDGLGPARSPRRRLPLRVAYHDACHLAHAQGVRQEPRRLLAAIPDVTVVPLSEAEICCGSAGIFSLVQPDMAAELGLRKATHITAAAPDIVVTSNPGCLLQLQAAARKGGHQWRVMHLATLLDEVTHG